MRFVLKLFVLFVFVSCVVTCREEDEPNDPATLISGIYTGEYKYSGIDERYAADVTIERVNDTTAYLSAFIEGHSGYTRKVFVKALDDGRYEIQYISGSLSNSLGGMVTANTLEYMFNLSETFWGNKPINEE